MRSGGMVRRNTSFQLHSSMQQFIQQSPRYLLTGVVLGVMGFLVAVLPYLMRVAHQLSEDRLERSDVPPTVSELVSRWETVEARIFFGFELVAALLILISEYPFKLKNAGCVPSAGGCTVCVPYVGNICSWATFRQIVPPLGLTLVALCPTVKMDAVKDPNPADAILVFVHCFAAANLFVGFLIAEAHTLCVKIPGTNYAPFYCARANAFVEEERADPVLRAREMNWRWLTWVVAFVCFIFFQFFQVIVLVYKGEKRRYNVISFLLEVIAGISMLLNHGIIWYYCHERHWGTELARALNLEHQHEIEVELPVPEGEAGRRSTVNALDTAREDSATSS